METHKGSIFLESAIIWGHKGSILLESAIIWGHKGSILLESGSSRIVPLCRQTISPDGVGWYYPCLVVITRITQWFNDNRVYSTS
jgi:hypothetical protein